MTAGRPDPRSTEPRSPEPATAEPDTAEAGAHDETPEPAPGITEAERRRRRALVFGDVLPDSTRDERGDGWSEREPGREGSDEWFRGQVPPHHG